MVLYGAFDSGAAPLIDPAETVAERRIKPDDFKVLARSELAPYCTFAAAANVPEKWIGKVRDALVNLRPATTAEIGVERIAVLQPARISQFEVMADADYDALRRWPSKTEMPSY